MHTLPEDIERESMRIIGRELSAMGIELPDDQVPVVKRVIHATADFDFAKTLVFTPNAVAEGIAALQRGTPIVTDTNMIRSGISRAAMEKTGSAAHCLVADEDVARAAAAEGTTRAVAAMRKAAAAWPGAIYAVGNAPTALLQLAVQLEQGMRPALVISVPVGFVNVLESKERILHACREAGVPLILSAGRKGGSTVAAAICNALLYAATSRQI